MHRAAPENPFQHRQQPRLLLFGADRGSKRDRRAARLRTGPRALRAQVQNVRAFVQQSQRVRHRRFRVEEESAIAEGIGRDVDDAHDERAAAKFERARAQLPGGGFPPGCVHSCVHHLQHNSS